MSLNETKARLAGRYERHPKLGHSFLAGTQPDGEWSRGYYCAVAVLLRETGSVTTEVESLFRQGGGVEYSDEEDAALFREHGLLPPAQGKTES